MKNTCRARAHARKFLNLHIYSCTSLVHTGRREGHHLRGAEGEGEEDHPGASGARARYSTYILRNVFMTRPFFRWTVRGGSSDSRPGELLLSSVPRNFLNDRPPSLLARARAGPRDDLRGEGDRDPGPHPGEEVDLHRQVDARARNTVRRRLGLTCVSSRRGQD